MGRECGFGVRPKRSRIVELYTNPPPNSTVVCVDELGPVTPRFFPPAPGWSPVGHRIKAPLEYGRGRDKAWVFGLSPWPTLIGLLALTQVRTARGDRAGARTMLAEARAMLEAFPDAGIFPDLLERQERKLRTRRSREGQLNGELTERELDVLRLLGSELSTRQMAQSLYVSPSTIKTQVKSIYRKLGVSSRGQAVEEAHARRLSSLPTNPYPLGEMCWWVKTNHPAVHYALQNIMESGG